MLSCLGELLGLLQPLVSVARYHLKMYIGNYNCFFGDVEGDDQIGYADVWSCL